MKLIIVRIKVIVHAHAFPLSSPHAMTNETIPMGMVMLLTIIATMSDPIPSLMVSKEQALFAQEQDSNRSTLVQKIRLLVDGGLKNNQKEFTNQFAKQHYMPNFKALYGKDSEEFKTFIVDAEFEPLKIDGFDDVVEAVTNLNEKFPLTIKATGELLGLENFEDMVDFDIPRPDPNSKGMSFTNEKGEIFEQE